MQSIPVQSWTFEHEPVIRIGRSTDNHVILYSAVVSRHHVEIREVGSGWEIVNLGANGTYLEGKRITQVPVVDGVVIRLARSGPNVQIHLGAHRGEIARGVVPGKTLDHPTKQLDDLSLALPRLDTPDPVPCTAIPELDEPGSLPNQPQTDFDTVGQVDVPAGLHTTEASSEAEQSGAQATSDAAISPSDCCYRYLNSDRLFCLDCGNPLHIIGTVGEYQILKNLEQTGLELTQMVWQGGRTLLLKTLSADWMGHPEAAELFYQEAQRFLQLHHPALPRFLDVFLLNGQPYLVLEPIYGQTLEEVVAQKGPLSSQQVIALLLQICDVLSYLHQQSPPILHQAIKPEYLIRPTRVTTTPLVLMGLHPCRSQAASLQYVPTDYAPPEQQQGQAFPSSDLYSLGPILAYLLTGKPCNTFYTQGEQGWRFYPEYVPGLFPELIAIARKLTNPQPDERFSTAQELAEALRQVPMGDI
jgi:serine/threonine-protein kinase